MKKLFRRFFLMAVIAVAANTIDASAQEKIYSGVAANYILVFKELSLAFETQTGTKVEAAFTSSGNIYSQIVNGAPYDIFLSADEERPARLHKEGLAEKPFIYARGQVVLWSARKDFCKNSDWKETVKGAEIKKISIVNPEVGPYGLAAKKALQKAGLWDLLKSRIVYSQDVAQAFHYAATGATDAGFCALLALYSKQGRTGCHYSIEEAPSVIQSACVLQGAKNRKTAHAFAAFLNSAEAEKIKAKYGYR